ncbi:MAG: VanZ family protein [Lautropia sp.]
MELLIRPAPRLRLVAALALAAAIAFLLVGGQKPIAVGLFVPPWDKVAHLVTYAGLTVLFVVAADAARRPWRAVAFIAVLGAIDEFAQSFAPGRVADAADWITDVAAAVLTVLVIGALRRRSDRRRAAALAGT